MQLPRPGRGGGAIGAVGPLDLQFGADEADLAARTEDFAANPVGAQADWAEDVGGDSGEFGRLGRVRRRGVAQRAGQQAGRRPPCWMSGAQTEITESDGVKYSQPSEWSPDSPACGLGAAVGR